jgi:hypothetical protein
MLFPNLQFANRTKPISQGLKAEESRNIVLFYFKVLVDAMETLPRKILWRQLAFLLRSYAIPQAEFKALNQTHLRKLAIDWLTLFQREFGKEYMTYNIHQVKEYFSL